MSAPVLVLISSKSEWRAVKAYYPQALFAPTPYGEWFEIHQDDRHFIFCQGGVGKVSAAASTDFAVQRWQPRAVVNLGTCGGIAGQIETGEIVLASQTIIYDIIEQMSDPVAALARYTTQLDLTWLPHPYPMLVRLATLVSADRDLLAADIPYLRQQFNAVAADWESGAIAWVTSRYHLPCLILRGVTDLVDSAGGEAYGNPDLYHANTQAIMPRLLQSLPHWLAQTPRS